MYMYVGYGFDSSDVSNETLLKLIRERTPDEYARFVAYCEKRRGRTDEETLLKEIRNGIEDEGDGVPDIIARIINDGEAKRLAGEDLVEVCDDYIAFPTIGFADESKRAMVVRSREAFAKIVGKYLNLDELTFACVYGGDEWGDPNYFME